MRESRKYTLGEASFLGVALPVMFVAMYCALLPFMLWEAWVTRQVWIWFFERYTHFVPPIHVWYASLMVVSFYRKYSIKKDEPPTDWSKQITYAIIGPALTLVVAYIMHRIYP